MSVLSRNRLAGAGRIGGVPVAADEGPAGRLPSIVERRLAHQLDLDGTVEALDESHQHVLGIIVGGRSRMGGDTVGPSTGSHRERVMHEQPASRRVPRGGQHVGARHIRALGGYVDAVRAEAE